MTIAESYQELVTNTTREFVLQKPINRNRKTLENKWRASEILRSRLSILAALEDHQQLDRNFILSITDDDELLFAASLIWGYGTHPRYRNIINALETGYTTPEGSPTSLAVAVLNDAREKLRGNDVEEAFRCFYNGPDGRRNTTRIKGMQTPFITKILYFLGQQEGCDPQPLIFDLKVARNLDALARAGSAPMELAGLLKPQTISFQNYLDYCNWANAVKHHGKLIDPTVVEYALFSARM